MFPITHRFWALFVIYLAISVAIAAVSELKRRAHNRNIRQGAPDDTQTD